MNTQAINDKLNTALASLIKSTKEYYRLNGTLELIPFIVIFHADQTGDWCGHAINLVEIDTSQRSEFLECIGEQAAQAHMPVTAIVFCSEAWAVRRSMAELLESRPRNLSDREECLVIEGSAITRYSVTHTIQLIRDELTTSLGEDETFENQTSNLIRYFWRGFLAGTKPVHRQRLKNEQIRM
jgi:hypothetical protein